MPHAALREVLGIAGMEGTAAIHGDDPVLPTRYRVAAVAESAWRGVPEDLSEEELQPLLGEMNAPDGRIRYLKPIVQLSETLAFWTRPPVPLGYHPPVWTFA